MVGLGWGSLKQMNDTLRQNREMLIKRKSSYEHYKEEVRKRDPILDERTLDFVKARVSEKLKRNKTEEAIIRIAALVFIVALVVAIVLIVNNLDFNSNQSRSLYPDTTKLFKVVQYELPYNRKRIVEYYTNGMKAAETNYSKGYRHQNSESYYESGQQFRSALYNYDTLITEVYLFKSGDTIKGFPVVEKGKVVNVRAQDLKRNIVVSFNFYDGKVIQGTYKELAAQ